MTKLTYHFWLFYRSGLLEIVEIYTNNILILTNNIFTSKKEEVIKNAKIIIKDYKYFISIQPMKFNIIEIKLNLNGIILTKKSHIGDIFQITILILLV